MKIKSDKNSEHPNPNMLILARESRGLTQQQLAEKLGTIKQFKLSKMESGFIDLNEEYLFLIAEALDYPVHFFYQKDSIYGPAVSELFHRKLRSIPNKVLTKAHALVQIKYMQVQRLMNSVDIEHLKMPEYSTDEYTPQQIAKMTRATWMLPNGPIKNVVEVIENAGGIIIPMNFGTDKIDAISRWVPGSYPLFFISTDKPMDRIRFSLCHELGHIIMHKLATPEMEDEADLFASEFLMPKNDIKEDLENLRASKLPVLKMKWRTSMIALTRTAAQIGAISETVAKNLYIQLSRKGYRSKEPDSLEPPQETPTLFNELLQMHLNELSYSKNELSDLLTINEKELEDMLPSSRPKLKIIK